jgi:hypothetical protein
LKGKNKSIREAFTMRHSTFGIVLGFLLVFAVSVAAETPTDWIRAIQWNGFVSTSYTHNENNPQSRRNQFRTFDFDHNSFKLDVIQLVGQKPVEQPRDAGFRVDLTYGHSIPPVMAAAGNETQNGTDTQYFHIQQGYLSYIAPIGSGLRIDFGRFAAPIGYEATPGYEGWNDHFSNSFLSSTAPGTLFGFQLSYELSEHIGASVFAVNGYDIFEDNNTNKTVGAQLRVTPLEKTELVYAMAHGPERAGNNRDKRTLHDVYATIEPMEDLTVAAHYSYRTEERFGIGPKLKTRGVAGYLRYDITDRWYIAVRGEQVKDFEAGLYGAVVPAGTDLKLSSITVTPGFKLTEHLMLRAEARFDKANVPAFERRNLAANVNRQQTWAFNAIYSF